MTKRTLKIGCDPEFFAFERSKANYDTGFISGVPFAVPPVYVEDAYLVEPLNRTDEKHPLYREENLGDGYLSRIVGDGVAFEMNFNQPHHSPEEMFDMVTEGKERLQEWLLNFNLGLWDKSTINFDYLKYWTEGIENDPRYKWSVIFGCDPDVDAFNVDWLCTILNAPTHPHRYGGGHIHISGHPLIGEHPIPFVKLLALTAGNFCIANATNAELESKRATYYGKPGKYRVQRYKDGSVGVEYRTPSNQWTSWTKDTFVNMFYWVNRALDLLEEPRKGQAALNEFETETVSAITTANTALSKRLLERIG